MVKEFDFASHPFDLLRLGVGILADAGGDPEPFIESLGELEKRWAAFEVDAARLQQDIYEAVLAAWKWQRGCER